MVSSGFAIHLCLLVLTFQGFPVVQACSKFSFAQETVNKVTVELSGFCYYGFLKRMTWTEANKLCAKEGTHLVFLETTKEQRMLLHLLGFNGNSMCPQGSAFANHWTGLRYLNGGWFWYYDSSLHIKASHDAMGRWDGEAIGESAYTLVSESESRLKGADLTLPLLPVCEDDATLTTEITAMTSEQTTEIVDTTWHDDVTSGLTTTLDTTSSSPETSAVTSQRTTDTMTTTSQQTAETTTVMSQQTSETMAVTSQKTADTTTGYDGKSSAADEIVTGYFCKQTALTNVHRLSYRPCNFRRACAVQCLQISGCHHFIFASLNAVCHLYEDRKDSSEGHALITCGTNEKCYSRRFEAAGKNLKNSLS